MQTKLHFPKHLLALVLLVLTAPFLSSCEQSSTETGRGGILPMAPPVSSGPIATTTAITLSPSANVTAGTTVTISAITTPVSSTITEGELSIQIATDSFGNYTSASQVVNWVELGSATGGSCSVDFTPAVAGTYGFRAHYVPKGSGFRESKSPGTDLIVVEEACEGIAQLTAEIASATSSSPFTFTITYRVRACEEITNAKLQGGLVAGVTDVSASSSLSTAIADTKTTKQNYILSWKIPYMSEGQEETFSVTYTKKITSFPAKITGAWSLKGSDGSLLDSYTNPLMFELIPTP